MQYLLDTNACIAVMRNHPAVVGRMKAATPSACAISTVTAYELFTGVEKCADPNRERPKVARLLSLVRVLPFDMNTGIEAARIRAMLEAQGQMIGPYDVLLAGHAKATGSRLVSNNTGEFGRVPGLLLEDWQTVP